MGLVDEVVPPPVLLEAAAARALRLADAPAPPTGPLADVQRGFAQIADAGGAQAIALEANPIGRKVLFSQARKQLLRKTRGNYPAQERIIDAVEAGYARGEAFGYEAESRFFGELVVSPEASALIGIFEATTALKKDSGVDDPSVEPREVRSLGMLGAGLMGAGIAYVTVEKADVDVRLKDQDDAGLARGLAQIWKSYERALSRRRTTRQQAERQMHRVTATTGYDGIERCDVVVEAVPEILELKHRVLRDVEAITDENTIFASNTSSIPIARIAEASRRPETVIGMHYFSPVEKMPLLEIIVTPETAPWVTATAVALGKRQGKTVIVVGDGPGFYTSRILSPYLNEAAYLLTEGVPVDGIDETLVRWGFPVGPLTLLDEVGVDVASKVGPIMVDAFGPRMEPPGTTEILVEDGRLGRKAKKGFYRYDGAKKGKRAVDESIYTLLGVTPRESFDAEAVVERCALAMVNEAARCLEEGILRSARDGDIGAVFGLGFPPFRGGPFRYVDAVGARAVVERLDRLRAEHGLRFEAAEILRERARTGRPLSG
jgi:3-hydroxyacyl-CoA dehydrogenase/enoyl-CoA hydratase/3-hydroxybutyryl-CoA epimerase